MRESQMLACSTAGRWLTPTVVVFAAAIPLISLLSHQGGRAFSAEPIDLGRRLEIIASRKLDWLKKEREAAFAQEDDRFIAENRDAIIAYVEKGVEEVIRPENFDQERFHKYLGPYGVAVRADREKGLALCLRLLRNLERTLLILEEFLFNAKVNYWEVLGEGGTKFVRLVQDTIRGVLAIFTCYHSSLAVPEAKRYLLLEWPHMGLDVNALNYLTARGIDDLEVRAWLETLAKDPNSPLNKRDYLVGRLKAYKKW